MAFDLLHIDPINLIIVVSGIIVIWTTLRNDSKWHTDWIKKHSAECDELRKANNEILNELRTSNEHLSTLTESHHERLGRIETQMDRQDRQ